MFTDSVPKDLGGFMVEFADLALPVCDITIESPSHVEMPPGMHGPGRGWLSFSLSLSLSLFTAASLPAHAL